jgi:hypothetical protein
MTPGCTLPNHGVSCCRKPTLRSGFRQQLTPSVDMTSDVKGWEQLFYVCILLFSLGLSEEPEPVTYDG